MNIICNHHDCKCKGNEICGVIQKTRVISEETTPYFDVGQKLLRALDQQQREPYQPRYPRTS